VRKMYAQTRNRVASRIALLAATAFLVSTPGHAALIPVLDSVSASSSNTTYTYQVDLLPDESLDPSGTAGVTCPGPASSLVQCNPAGTFVTIYDIPDFVSASSSSPGWFATVQTTGITPSTVSGAFDDPGLVNVTFFYTGPVVMAQGTEIPLTGFEIVSSIGGTSNGEFAYQATKDTGMESGNTDQGDGPVVVPGSGSVIQAVPEPSSMGLWGGGLVLLGISRRFFSRS
jgi:hypothetical protein